jgi:hypothetical protein
MSGLHGLCVPAAPMRRLIPFLLFLGACAADEPARTPAPNTATGTAFDAAAPGLPAQEASPSPSVPPSTARNVTITSPAEGEVLRSNPIRVTGTARTFENNVSLRVRGADGNVLTETFATATGELGNFNPWDREIFLTAYPGGRLTVEAWESSAKDGSVQSLVRVDTRFEAPRKTFTIYQHDPAQAPDDCTKVFPVKRDAPASLSEARLLLEMLIAEKGSPFPRGSGVKGVNIRGGAATVDFNYALRNVGGSCRAQAIRSSVEKTLGALPGVSRVVITAEGDEGQALQP